MFTGIDELGNLTFDGDKAWTYTWDGRQLVYIVEDGGSPQFTFDYNADGIRTRKGITDYGDEWTYHSYTLDGTTILKETIYFESYGVVENSRDIYYYYDENGAPLGLNWNNTDYYYYKNIFGDILGIMDANGDMVVRYAYDAWGNPISTTGSKASTLGKDNPFRYRGYYYDTETGLYYLNARYYNPEWGRFISPDPVLDTSSAVGCNMFAYCGNDPIENVDSSGMRYCAADSVQAESPYDRFISGDFQRLSVLIEIGAVIDITNTLNEAMNRNLEALRKYREENGIVAAWWYFYCNVKDGGPLDLKLLPEWKFEEGKTYMYRGRKLRYDDPGNINFGFVGAEVFYEWVLHLGAGVNQIRKYWFAFGDIFSCFDDPRDYWMVEYGFYLHRGVYY